MRTAFAHALAQCVPMFAAVVALATGASSAIAQPSASEPSKDDAGLAAELAAAERRAAQATHDDPAEPGQAPARLGLTVEASAGVGGVYVAVEKADNHRVPARAGINVGVGGFVTPHVALGVRIASGSTVEQTITGTEVRSTHAFAGPTLQYWASDRVFLGIGLGVGFVFDDRTGVEGLRGFAGDLRVGYNVHLTRQHAFYVAAEVTPALYETGTLVGGSLQFGWQML